ncbi:MAG TPA: hypothetical protein O0X00_06750, partial [Methanocorpusculum sp.]|nr:hypothetical protein [Methanocorpusculum sp.]
MSEFSPDLWAQVSCGTAELLCHTAETTSHSNHHTHKHSFIVVKDGIRIPTHPDASILFLDLFHPITDLQYLITKEKEGGTP